MAQVTNGLRAVLSHPFVYSLFQFIMGGNQARRNFANAHLHPFPRMKILDIGCGPADILNVLPDVDYWGYDISQSYIDVAKKKYGNRGKFNCKQLELKDLSELPKFDMVLALGLLHHLNDKEAHEVLEIAGQALGSNGVLITVDPCLTSRQNPIARFLIRRDRGQNVRDLNGYLALSRQIFPSTDACIQNQAWIPYTHCIMHCKK